MGIVLNLILSTVAAVTGFFGFTDHFFTTVGSDVFYSVEAVLAEVSPRGMVGGLAVPASGESETCSLAFSPSSVEVGNSTTVSWSFSGPRASYVSSEALYRCDSGITCATFHDHWTDADARAAGYVAVYSWSGNCTTSNSSCPTSTSVGTSGLTDGTYKYGLLATTYNPSAGSSGGCIDSGACDPNATTPNLICSANLTVTQISAECNDGIDNDGDGHIDWTSDPDCLSTPDDNDESGITVTLEVQNDTTGSGWTGSDIAINPGEEVSLRWTSSGSPDSCSGSGSGFSTGGATNGTDITITEPIAGNFDDYTVVCSKMGAAQVSDSLRVTTRSPASIDADPTIVYQGEQSTVTWSTGTTDPATCSVSGPEINLPTLTSSTGSQDVNVGSESVYTINCGVGSTDSVTIRVLPVIQET